MTFARVSPTRMRSSPRIPCLPYRSRSRADFLSILCRPPVAEWLRGQGHDVIESRALGPDPGEHYSKRPKAEFLDHNFGELVYVRDVPHAGLVRLPDVPDAAYGPMAEVLDGIGRRWKAVTAVVDRVRVSQPHGS